MNKELIYQVTDFVAVCNQILDTTLGSVVITGELANFKVSKNKWIYFDLKDEFSSVRFFGTVYQLPCPLEDGMMLLVRGLPQLHPRFGFSVTIQSLQLSGEGTIKKASDLLHTQLEKEGLFDKERKRPVPYPPQCIGLITSGESAGFSDFIKVLNERWGRVEILLYDVHVQGERAPSEVVSAIEFFNANTRMPDVLVVLRGGGSVDDLQAFSTEVVTRAVAASRIPTLVAVGHEVDVSLAELAADQRASTPSNAAELLVPDRKHVLSLLMHQQRTLGSSVKALIDVYKNNLQEAVASLDQGARGGIAMQRSNLQHHARTLELLNPSAILRRGYAIIRQSGKVVASAKAFRDLPSEIQFHDGNVTVNTNSNKV